jgi:hypothetical protein
MKSSRAVAESPYDNPNTILYKYAKKYNRPISNIVLYKFAGESVPYNPLTDVVESAVRQGQTLIDIYNTLIGDNSKLSLLMLKRAYIMSKGVISDESNQPLVNDVLFNLNQLDLFTNSLTVDIRASIVEIRLIMQTADLDYATDLVIDIARADEIIAMQTEFERVTAQDPWLMSSPVNINSAIFLFKPVISGVGAVTPRYGFKIFDSIIVSQNVPYAQYNTGDGRSYSKLYSPSRLDAEPKYKIITAPKEQTQKSDTIYLTLWLGNDKDDFYTATSESFHTVTISLDKGEMTINIPFNIRGVKTENEILTSRRIAAALPILNIGEESRTKVRADTSLIPIYNPFNGSSLRTLEAGGHSPNYPGSQFEMQEHAFLHLCLLDNMFFRNIYAEESVKPASLKKRLDLHYRSAFSDANESNTPISENYISNSASVSFTITVRKTGIGESINVIGPSGVLTNVSVQQGYSYIHLNITKADSKEMVDEFLRVMKPLFLIYWETILERRYVTVINEANQYKISDLYNFFVPETATLYEAKRRVKLLKAKKAGKTGRGKTGPALLDLYNKFPQVFGGRYSSICTGKQPVILRTQDEIQAWSNEVFTKKGTQRKRQVIPFPAPPTTPLFYFACPSNDNPYPGVKLNTTGHNQEEFPYVPCCFGTDQTKERRDSGYNEYYKGKPRTKGKNMKGRLNRAGLLEPPGRVGALPSNIEYILSKYSPDVGELDRFGVIRSQSSFLHAVLYAISDRDYLEARTDEAKELYVTSMRKYLSEIVNPELLKQELYDMNNQDIRRRMADPQVTMDPSLFYHAIEEIYNINIYTFSSQSTSIDDLGSIEIPRNKYFHTRPLKFRRQTVVIYKHIGSDTNDLKYHQCDLCIDRRVTGDVTIFGIDMTEVCHTALERSMSTITWTMPGMKAYSNMYNVVDFSSIINNAAISQYIDGNGKCRALTFMFRDRPVTMMIFPTQPINVPHSNEFAITPLNTALQLFSDPTSVVRGSRPGLPLPGAKPTDVIGVWFRLIGIDSAIYVKVNSIGSDLNLPEGPPDPLSTDGKSMVDRLGHLRRQISFIIQLVRWVFDLGRILVGRDTKGYPLDFFTNYTTVPEGKNNPDHMYDFSGLRDNLLPEVSDFREAIAYIAKVIPTMVKDGKLLMYSEDFRNKVYNNLKTYFNDTYMQPVPVRGELVNFYLTERDFTARPNEEIFTSIDDLNNWLLSRVRSEEDMFTIYTKLNLSMSVIIDPYLYKDSEGRVYIIQNTVDGKLGSAARVAQEWKDRKINIGSNVKPLREASIPGRFVFGINAAGSLIPISDVSRGNSTFLRIIFYGTNENLETRQGGRYGAILPMI